jgi:molybdopterin synthase catalytic subunit
LIGVRVRLFARQREVAGTREVRLELPAGSTIEDAWLATVKRHPAVADARPWMRFARNAEYADPTTRLEDGDEVACVPPVSGGATAPQGGDPTDAPDRGLTEAPSGDPTDAPDRDAGPSMRILELREAPFGAEILAELAGRLARPADGAVVGFLGVTRETPGTPAPGQEAEAARHAGREVKSLEYEAHETMVVATLGRIVDEMAERFGVRRVAIVHRVGDVPLGQPSIAIVVCSPHRGPAFEAARYAIEETKARAPIWKAEHFADGHVWVGAPAREGPSAAGGA